jgi:dsDNA-specific endonuclease/ATPase MutS2
MVLQITPNILQTEIGNLTDDDLRKVVQAKKEKPEEKMEQKKKPDDVVEVDLHIQELMDNTAGLESQEILELQMAKVESEMRTAIRTGVKRIVFIHGVGQGVLKQEVAKVLKSKFSKYYFQDASFREYGYGATMVILRKG